METGVYCRKTKAGFVALAAKWFKEVGLNNESKQKKIDIPLVFSMIIATVKRIKNSGWIKKKRGYSLSWHRL